MNKLIEANKSSAQVCVSSDKDRGRGATRSRNKPVQRPTNGKRWLILTCQFCLDARDSNLIDANFLFYFPLTLFHMAISQNVRPGKIVDWNVDENWQYD
jgi:hypothetical protein